MELSPSQRIKLSDKLHAIMDPLGGKVYYQPPENTKLVYPCLIYELDDVYIRRADNGPYSMYDRYQVTFLRHEPESPVIRQLLALEHSSFSRHFATSGVNHDVFVIYHK